MKNFDFRNFVEIVLFVILMIVIIGLIMFVGFAIVSAIQNPTKNDLIRYEVVGVIDYKQPGDSSSTYYKVLINDHDYTKIESTAYTNIIFKHDKNCSYCHKLRHHVHKNEVFTTNDGFTVEMMKKRDKLKGAK